jgi:hypothetical protein
MGWILVHTSDDYGEEADYKDPMEQLRDVFEPGLLWHWKLPRPMRTDKRKRRVLLAWNQGVFGEAKVTITREIDRGARKNYNFAFELHTYRELKQSIPFSQLRLGSREKNHRGLIRLDGRILDAYDKLARGGTTRVFSPTDEIAEVEAAIDARAKPLQKSRARGQAFFQNAEQRRCVELHAMMVAEKHLVENGYEVSDVSATKSYDYSATKCGVPTIVEVKGTTGAGEEIVITRKELHLHQEAHPGNMLIVVHSIKLSRSSAKPRASGGVAVVRHPWAIKRNRLKPLAFAYTL